MKILVTLPCEAAEKERLEAVWPGAEYRYSPAERLTAADVADAEIILGNIPAALLADCRALRWLQLNTAGADQYVGRMPHGNA